MCIIGDDQKLHLNVILFADNIVLLAENEQDYQGSLMGWILFVRKKKGKRKCGQK